MDNGFVERLIPDPGFAGDTGTADPALTAALAAYADGQATHGDVLLVLQDSRVLVPVVAVLGEVEIDEQGLAHDKTSDMAVVLIQRPDGRVGLLAFTSTDTLSRWNSEARPVPVGAPLAARAAVQEEAAALVIDIAGPSAYVIEGEDLTALAAGWRLARVGPGTGWLTVP